MNKAEVHSFINGIINGVNPKTAIEKKLEKLDKNKNYNVIAVGKAAWEMANITNTFLGSAIKSGLVITKYAHSKGDIGNFEIIEAAHPVPDENSLMAGKEAMDFVGSIPNGDYLIFLLSGGGSALMEFPMDGVNLSDMKDVTEQLLSSGADIVEINTIRKHLSKVKGGRLADLFSGNLVHGIIISDVLSDRCDSIASGPMCADESTTQEALEIIQKYRIKVNENILNALKVETPKSVDNVNNEIILNINKLCDVTKLEAERLGYKAEVLTTDLSCEAKDAGRMISAIAKSVKEGKSEYSAPAALIFGGETVVTLNGDGLGGRNQELALAAAIEIKDIDGITIVAFGSDGTDGPTDAAGGFVDGDTFNKMINVGIDPNLELNNNNSNFALGEADSLLITGPTGTNLNDVYIAFIS